MSDITKSDNAHESKALDEEKRVKSTWFILDVDRKLIPLAEFNFGKQEGLKKFARYETEKVRAYSTEPPHIALMRQHELVDYEPGSDRGNMRFYPNGRLVKSLLERYVTDSVIDYGAVELETPIMYDYRHPALSAYLNRFPARHYTIKSDDKEYFLRFSADFGQFLLVKDATISYKSLPFKFYELTRYSFRREQSGEVVGLKRLRSFTMPDMHTLCSDMEQAKGEFVKQFELCKKTLADIGIPSEAYEMVIRFTVDFFNENKDFILSFAERYGKPLLIEMWNFRYAYFDPKFEFNIIDNAGKAAALSTVQIDHENGERYGITYTDSKGKKVYPILLHNSPSGAIERDIYALLEIAYRNKSKGMVPSLPVWLSPTQVRVIPVADRHMDRCMEISKLFRTENIRSDIDDTSNTIGKRVRAAENDWVPYIIIVGDKETKSKTLPVRIRLEKKQIDMEPEQLIRRIKDETKRMPTGKLSVAELVSKRALFYS